MLTVWVVGFGFFLSVIVVVAIHDVVQNKNAVLRNYPVVGHFRFLLQELGPKLRQYIVADNDEERPFSRDQRRWVNDSAQARNNYFGFGTDNDLDSSPNYLIIKPSVFPTSHPVKGDDDYDPSYSIACSKILGGPRDRKKAFRPASTIYVSAMSYGSLSGAAVEALNRGCQIADSLHNTGEGGIASYHDHGGDLIWQLGTGYFGARDEEGQFSMSMLRERVDKFRVRAIEVKLSQGAKPGRGGVLPAAKISPEIAEIRGIPADQDCISPPGHRAFSNADELLDFVESIAAETGLPVGIKSAVGQLDFWRDLATLMAEEDRGVDFINIDGGEGGTGAAPLVFSDHVALPFNQAFGRVHRIFAQRGLSDDIVFMGAGRLGFPERALLAFAMGADMIGVAREAMLAIGCIQAQRCHTDHCPTGVATHNRWLVRGLDPTEKSARLANYLVTLRQELMWLIHTLGVDHPSAVTLDHFEVIDDCFGGRKASQVFGSLEQVDEPEPQTKGAEIPVAE